MIEILFSYFIYNLVVGIVLTIYHLTLSKGKMGTENIAWLLLFPAVGLGKWVYARTIALGEQPIFPENWFVWKYMIKVNWGYLILIAAAPFLLAMLLFFGVAIGGIIGFGDGTMESFSEFGSMIETGIILFLIFGSITLLFVLAIPYLLLIHIPKNRMRSIEREVLISNQKMASPTQEPKEPTFKPISLLRNIHINVLGYLPEFKNIPSARKKELETVSTYIKSKLAHGEAINLTFICTHNSRRSQFAQIWAAVAAAFYGIKNVQTFSGGTEETAFNKRAVDAIRRAGFLVDGTMGTNPRYSVRFSDESGALDCYSKKFDNPANPQKGFAAIMTCDDADKNCPIILGAEFRAHITYEDPNIADRTESETATYNERCRQIATEMLYLFSRV